ncbi:15769_t:CDS:1, partial [Gigaspora rosea]
NTSTSIPETSFQKQTYCITLEPKKAILTQLFDNEENLSKTLLQKFPENFKLSYQIEQQKELK